MTDQTAAAVDPNEGPGWYEVINPRGATTCIAYVHEDGSLYLPEGEASMNAEEFAFAAARGQAHRLVRADDLPAPATTVRDAARQAAGQAGDPCRPVAECPPCGNTGACNGGPRAHPDAAAWFAEGRHGPTPDEMRQQIARAIRDNVRLRLGPNALRLAEEGRPVMMNMSEAEAATDAVLAVRDAARQAAGQPVCACGHPQGRHNTACAHCPCVGYAETWPPQAAGQTPTTEQPTMDPAAALRAAANKIESHAWFSEGTAYDNGRDGAIEWAVSWLRSMANEAAAGVRNARPAAGQRTHEPSARSSKEVVFAAVYAHIRGLAPDYVPSSVVERNASIWRAVHAALAALSDAAAERPVVEQPAEAQPAEVLRVRDRWYVEYLFGQGNDAWWGVAQGPHASREQALSEKETRRDAPAERRLVRETTTWTVEETR